MSNFVNREMRRFVRKSLHLTVAAVVLAAGTLSTNQAEAGPYSIARKYVGLHEKTHTRQLAGTLGVNPRRTPWCGAFVGAVMKRAGKKPPSGYMKAASWSRVGKAVPLKNAKKGDVVVVRTKYGHHVGLFAGQKGGRVLLLGGNQSNRVQVSGYKYRSIKSIRRM